MLNNIIQNQWVVGIGINAVFLIICKAIAIIDTKFKTKDPRLSDFFFISLTIIWLSLILINGLYQYHSGQVLAPIITFSLLSVIYSSIVVRKFRKFAMLGIVGTDYSTIQGINYDASLKLCNSELKFLGIGASKLTSSQFFKPALLRCKQDKPIKFLLLNPRNETLVKAARRADKDPNKYHLKVVKSLKILREFKTDRELDIQIRFYNNKPIFRLMFIDNSLCLFGGYTQIGVDDGSKLPQIHLVNKSDIYHATCLYSTLEQYFDDLWNKSEEWDFQTHLL